MSYDATSKTPPPAWKRRTVGHWLAVVSVAVIAFATLLPQPDVRVHESLCVICGTRGGVDAVLNVLLFLPLGVSLALAAWSIQRALPAMAVLSAGIELAQLTIVTGRDASVGDVVTNFIGGAAGFMLLRQAGVLLFPSARTARRLAAAWAFVWLGVQAVVAYAVTPVLPASAYYGQLGRSFGGVEQFPGVVLGSALGRDPISDGRLPDSCRVAQALLDGRSMVVATLLIGNATHSVSPIVRIADGESREIALLAQRGSDLLFAIRTGATVLRLRPTVFLLQAELPTTVGRQRSVDTVVVRARQDARAAQLGARWGATTDRERVFANDIGRGWTLFLPFQWYITASRTELWLGACWLGLSIIPFGYWLRSTQPHGKGSKRLSVAIPTLFVIAVGLGAIPSLFQIAQSPITLWAGTAAGAIVGIAVARGTTVAHARAP